MPARPRSVGLLGFALGVLLCGLLQTQADRLADTDSEYHLAAARLYAAEGLLTAELPWARFSVMARGWGDKELLFHWLLVPFALLDDPWQGGRLALVLLGGLISALTAALAARFAGAWGLVVPLALLFGAPEFGWRLVRLRPELLALVLLLMVLAAVCDRRERLLVPLGALFALSYTAAHLVPGLCLLIFLWRGGVRREWRPGLALYPMLGSGLGLLLHPQFPANLAVFWVQNVEFFLWRSQLDVGSEIEPLSTQVFLFANFGFWLALGLLWRARAPRAEPVAAESLGAARRAADAFGVAAVLFAVLYLLMSRFALYALPLAALALLAAIAARAEWVGDRVRGSGRRNMPLAMALAIAAAISLPSGLREFERFRQRTWSGPGDEARHERSALKQALPPGSRVAAPWGAAGTYALFAPGGRYLNLLDPVFMAAAEPQRYWLQRSLFEGGEPDLAAALAIGLDSDRIAFPVATSSERLRRRLAGDPRLVELHRGSHAVFALRPLEPSPFVLDWTDEEGTTWPHPLAPSLRGLEGYVDLTRLGLSELCARLATQLPAHAASPARYELAAYGPARIEVDGRRLAATDRRSEAVLGEGIVIERPATARREVLVMESCPSGQPPRNGFFLVRR